MGIQRLVQRWRHQIVEPLHLAYSSPADTASPSPAERGAAVVECAVVVGRARQSALHASGSWRHLGTVVVVASAGLRSLGLAVPVGRLVAVHDLVVDSSVVDLDQDTADIVLGLQIAAAGTSAAAPSAADAPPL